MFAPPNEMPCKSEIVEKNGLEQRRCLRRQRIGISTQIPATASNNTDDTDSRGGSLKEFLAQKNGLTRSRWAQKIPTTANAGPAGEESRRYRKGLTWYTGSKRRDIRVSPEP